MLTYVYNSLFDSPAQTLVNTVNTVGVMGKGIAKAFKEKYPYMFREYKRLCDSGELSIGKIHLWRSPQRLVLNFPTKTTWKKPSNVDYIKRGLDVFTNTYKELGITSVAFPPLGCGNGNLDWLDVKPVMEAYLQNVEIPVYIHNIHFGPEFVPEHKESVLPTDLQAFQGDVIDSIKSRGGQFYTIDGNQQYTVQKLLSGEFEIITAGRRRETIPADEIERAWLGLRDGILSVDGYGDDRSRKYKSYLFPIFASLPYVRTAEVQRAGSKAPFRSIGLYFDRDGRTFENIDHTRANRQGWLFQ